MPLIITKIIITIFLLITPACIFPATLEVTTSLGHDSNIGEDSIRKSSFFSEYSLFFEFNKTIDKFDTFHALSLSINYRDYFNYPDNYDLSLKIQNYRYIDDKLKVELTPIFNFYRDNLFEDDDTNSGFLSLNITNIIQNDLEITLGFNLGNVSYLNYIPYSQKKNYRLRKFTGSQPTSQVQSYAMKFMGTRQTQTIHRKSNDNYEDREDNVYNIVFKTQYYFNKNLNSILSLGFVRNESNVKSEQFNGYISNFQINYKLTKKSNFLLGLQFEKDIFDENLANLSRDDMILSFSLKNDYKIKENMAIYVEYDFMRKYSVLDIDNTYKTELKCGLSFLF